MNFECRILQTQSLCVADEVCSWMKGSEEWMSRTFSGAYIIRDKVGYSHSR
jgi:hypothetical protein